MDEKKEVEKQALDELMEKNLKKGELSQTSFWIMKKIGFPKLLDKRLGNI